MSIYAVILCGGAGTRLWPSSTPMMPKQFVRLVGNTTGFDAALERVGAIEGLEGILVLSGAEHAAKLQRERCPEGLSYEVLLEPTPRDSAPAIAAAAAWIFRKDPDAIMVIVACDHHIPDAKAFGRAIAIAAAAAESDRIVVLGVMPGNASTAYGYIKPGDFLSATGDVRAVEAFTEKPDAASAATYLETGYVWNSGNFIVGARWLLSQLQTFAPEVLASASAGVESAVAWSDCCYQLGEAFTAAPRISIDYALMERTRRAAVVPVSFEWSDLGAWDAVRRVSPTDADGNASYGEVTFIDAGNCLVRGGDGRTVAVIGVRDIAVIVESEGVLVCDLAASQKVKAAVDQMRAGPVVAAVAKAPGSSNQTLPKASVRLDRWLLTTALPIWWSLGADHSAGGFHERLRQDGTSDGSPRRARVQARQIFVFAAAGLAGWRGPWLAASEHGLSYFTQRFLRPDGLFRTLVAADGRSQDATAKLYDQAFALLAMATVFQSQPERSDLEQQAKELLLAVRATFGQALGFREHADQAFQSNPHMHLLEAALAWRQAGGGSAWTELADELAHLAVTRLFDQEAGVVREFFDSSWRPAKGPDGSIVEPGHQFEWSSLLTVWACGSNDRGGQQVANTLFQAGLRGVDPVRGVAIDMVDISMRPIERQARLWPQTEWVKAACTLAMSSSGQQRESYLDHALKAYDALDPYLNTLIPGLWRDRLTPEGKFVVEAAPASSLYHLMSATQALRRCSEVLTGGIRTNLIDADG